MGIISCPQCHRRISDQAAQCPACGRELNRGPGVESTLGRKVSEAPSARRATREPTGRKWRELQIVGGIIMVAGVPVWYLSHHMPYASEYRMGIALMFGGLLVYVIGRIAGAFSHS